LNPWNRLSRSGGMADALDSKSSARKGVWVQVPPSVVAGLGPKTTGTLGISRGFLRFLKLGTVVAKFHFSASERPFFAAGFCERFQGTSALTSRDSATGVYNLRSH